MARWMRSIGVGMASAALVVTLTGCLPGMEPKPTKEELREVYAARMGADTVNTPIGRAALDCVTDGVYARVSDDGLRAIVSGDQDYDHTPRTGPRSTSSSPSAPAAERGSRRRRPRRRGYFQNGVPGLAVNARIRL